MTVTALVVPAGITTGTVATTGTATVDTTTTMDETYSYMNFIHCVNKCILLIITNMSLITV